jgi:HSP20 family protein
MALARWDPFAEMTSLREAMNRLFEESVIRPSALVSWRGVPLLDVYEEGDHYTIEMALPGVRPEDVDVSILANTVTIRGQWPARPEGRQYLHTELATGRFERSVTLPTELDADKAQAHYEHGVLRLVVPKAEAARPKRITVRTAS